MKKQCLLFILLFGNMSLPTQRPPINVKKVLLYTAEVIAPIVISSRYIPDMIKTDGHTIAVSLNICGIFLVSNSFIHGLRGLHTELKPAVQEYLAQRKQRHTQKTT